MSDIRQRLMAMIFRMTNLKHAKAEDIVARKIKGYLQLSFPPLHYRFKYKITSEKINGRKVYRIAPKKGPGKTTILYLHGGAYIFNSAIPHWNLADKLMSSLDCTIIYPDYPLAPESGAADIFNMLDPVYRKLLATTRSEEIVFVGDSSGGGLVLSLAQKMLLEGGPLPSKIIMLSPCLDISLRNPDIDEVDSVDPILSVKNLREVSERIFQGNGQHDYLVSPINGPMEGLPPVSLFVGTKEILLPDARKLRDLCKEHGVTINYFEYEGMIHDWILFGFPESRTAFTQLVELIKDPQ